MRKTKDQIRQEELEGIREYLTDVHCMTEDAVEEHIKKHFPDLLSDQDVQS